MAAKTVGEIKASLVEGGFDVDGYLSGMGHMIAIEERRHGKTFSIEEHLEGLLFSQLSSQRPWNGIEENHHNLKAIFKNFDPEALAGSDLDAIEGEVRAIHCGNRQIRRQIQALPENIDCFRRIEKEYKGLDSYVQSDKPSVIACEFGQGRRFKLKQVGFPLAMEYLRNVGIDAAKPDVHICRIIGPQRLGWAQRNPSPVEAVEIIREKAEIIGVNAAYLDGLLWLFAARGYGAICGAVPNCGICKVSKCKQKPQAKAAP